MKLNIVFLTNICLMLIYNHSLILKNYISSNKPLADFNFTLLFLPDAIEGYHPKEPTEITFIPSGRV